jgi:hypothetical protein
MDAGLPCRTARDREGACVRRAHFERRCAARRRRPVEALEEQPLRDAAPLERGRDGDGHDVQLVHVEPRAAVPRDAILGWREPAEQPRPPRRALGVPLGLG